MPLIRLKKILPLHLTAVVFQHKYKLSETEEEETLQSKSEILKHYSQLVYVHVCFLTKSLKQTVLLLEKCNLRCHTLNKKYKDV